MALRYSLYRYLRLNTKLVLRPSSYSTIRCFDVKNSFHRLICLPNHGICTTRMNFRSDIERPFKEKDNLSKNFSKKLQSWRNRGVLDLDTMYQHLVQDNAQNIAVIQLAEVAKYVKYFIVVTANSTRHLEYMAESLNVLYKQNKLESDPFSKIEGKRISSEWMSLDLGNAVVHFMLEETRERYELEKLWLFGAQFDDQVQLAARGDEQGDSLMDKGGLYGDDDFIEGSLNDVKFLRDLDIQDGGGDAGDDHSGGDLDDLNEKDYIV